MLGWLRPGTTREQAQAAITNFGAVLEQRYPIENRGMGRPGRIVSLVGREFGDLSCEARRSDHTPYFIWTRPPQRVCQCRGLAPRRSAYRQREIAVRTALGAHRPNSSGWARRRLCPGPCRGRSRDASLALADAHARRHRFAWRRCVNLALEADLALAAYALLLLIVTGLLCGIVPSWRATKTNVAAAIQTGESHGSTGRLWLRHAFVIGQVAACVILLVLSSLMLRSLSGPVDGFWVRSRPGPCASVHLDADRYATDGGLRLGERIVDRLEQLPGIESASLANIVALGTDASVTRFQTETQTDASTNPRTFINSVSPRYFATLGIPIVRGRDFEARDRQGSPPVVIVCEAFANAYFPGTNRSENACGRRTTSRTPKSLASCATTNISPMAKRQRRFSIPRTRSAPDLHAGAAGRRARCERPVHRRHSCRM